MRHSEPALSPQVLIDFPYTEHAQMARFSPGPGAAHGVRARHISVNAYGQLPATPQVRTDTGPQFILLLSKYSQTVFQVTGVIPNAKGQCEWDRPRH